MLAKLHPVTRWFMVLLSLLLGTAYSVSLWRIDLEAPQYPEGLSLDIWLNRMSGSIDTINGLNHYIGMKVITPDSFAELKFMPGILAGFIVTGLFVAIWNRRMGLAIWFGMLSLAGALGIWDFWRWTYDYGHNLNPHAAIKVPGMSYQPPLFGSKKLLNFTAHSYPALAGWMLIGTGLAVAGLLLFEFLRWRRQRPEVLPKRQTKASKMLVHSLILQLLIVFSAACAPKPNPLDYAGAVCTHCRMTLMERKFGAELVTKKGKNFAFDSVECLAEYWQQHQEVHSETHSLWVIDGKHPGVLLPAQAAVFLQSQSLRSPMGGGLIAVANLAAAKALQKQYPGQILNWEQILKLMRKP